MTTKWEAIHNIRKELRARALRAEARVRELETLLAALVGAVELCEASRGRFSCVEAHDCRCPKARAATPAEWRGEWVCVCGAEELAAIMDKLLV